MPTIIDYPIVLARMQELGFVSNYHNGGSFAFRKGTTTTTTHVVAHVGPPDPTIRPAALPLTIPIDPPHERNLARLATAFWQRHLPGSAWLMPVAHWAFELDPVTQPWFPELLRGVGLDPHPLIGLNNAAAIEFAAHESEGLRRVIEALFTNLKSSDFALAFPPHPVLCTLHHHRQLWWVASDAIFADQLRRPLPYYAIE